ncbi:MAG: EAL domain-containing protein [Nitrococcus sp.]|nr:EAL domain-containing protein [Nitrococcus sp.]
MLGSNGTLARLGGDEFGVLLNCSSADAAERCAWALCDAAEAFRFRWGERSFKLGASIGVVPGRGCVELAENALRVADAACLAAKEAGGHRVHVYHAKDENMLRRSCEMRWVTHISEALDEDRLLLYAQPIRSVKEASGAGMHFELLLRLREKDGQVVGPAALLPAAERYGLSMHIDRWVVNQLFRWGARHPERLRRIDVCSINLSGASLGDAEFLLALAERIADGPFAPSQLCFEITETAAIGNLANTVRFMGQLRRLGCAFALDDFGSGLSSLGYLRSLPVDYLKIDGLFVRNIADNRTDREMVRVISEMSAIMGLRTVAEFVESERVLATLEEIGIEYAQGYHIGLPVPLDQLFAGHMAEVSSDFAGAHY